MCYEFTGIKLINKRTFGVNFFNVERVSFRGVVMVEMGKLFVLDDMQGIWEMSGMEGIAGQMFASKSLVF